MKSKRRKATKKWKLENVGNQNYQEIGKMKEIRKSRKFKKVRNQKKQEIGIKKLKFGKCRKSEKVGNQKRRKSEKVGNQKKYFIGKSRGKSRK